MKSPLVSVDIRTLNSAATLEETLTSVKNQTYPNIEILVCDGHSKDETVKIAKRFGARVIYENKLGDARHKVFLASRGEYLISLDSDQVMDKELISECVKLSTAKNYNGLIISEKSFVTYNTYLERLITYDKYLINKDRNGNKVFDTACPRFFKRDTLLSIDWPDQLTIFDDTILYAMLLKRGAKIGFLSKPSIWHHEVGCWIVFIKKFYRYGKGYFNAFRVSPGVITAHSLPRRSYFSINIFRRPEYILPIFFLYIVKVSAASAGAFVSVLETVFSFLRDK